MLEAPLYVFRTVCSALLLPGTQNSTAVGDQPQILTEWRKLSASCLAPIWVIQPAPLSSVASVLLAWVPRACSSSTTVRSDLHVSMSVMVVSVPMSCRHSAAPQLAQLLIFPGIADISPDCPVFRFHHLSRLAIRSSTPRVAGL